MKVESNFPKELADVASGTESLKDFGLLLREWIHHTNRSDISNRPAIAASINRPPKTLASCFKQGELADAYLAAYAEWIADRAKIDRPDWVKDPSRTLEFPWFADNARASLLILTPASFRQRNVFTIPEDVVKLRRGRPRVNPEQKRSKARERDRRYRERQRKLIKLAKSTPHTSC